MHTGLRTLGLRQQYKYLRINIFKRNQTTLSSQEMSFINPEDYDVGCEMNVAKWTIQCDKGNETQLSKQK